MSRLLTFALCTLHFVLCTAAFSQEKPRLAFVGASWCPPCKVQSRDVVPELRKRGYEVLEYDIDTPNVKRVFPTATVPAWFAISKPFQAATADDVERALLPLGEGGRRPDEGLRRSGTLTTTEALTPALSQRERGPETKPSPDLVALFRNHLGDRASIEISLTDRRTIPLDDATRLLVPQILQADIATKLDANKPPMLVITFATPVPAAETVKLGATLAADLPVVRISGNRITASAELGLGVTRPIVIEVKELPWD